LIDLDGDWCTRFENGLPHTPERRSTRTTERKHKENIELLMLLVLGFHFNKYIKYNPFTAYFKDVFKQKGISPDTLHTMLREPNTISHRVNDHTTDLSLLPLNETYDHYFLNRDPNDDEVIIPDPAGRIFKDLCERIQEPYVPPSSATSLPVGTTGQLQSTSGRSPFGDLSGLSQLGSMSRSRSRSRSRGGEQSTLRYKISKRKGGSTKRKTLKIRKI
jgi:hypothetical protein